MMTRIGARSERREFTGRTWPSLLEAAATMVTTSTLDADERKRERRPSRATAACEQVVELERKGTTLSLPARATPGAPVAAASGAAAKDL